MKYKSLSNDTKIEIIELVESGEFSSKKLIAERYGIPPNTLSTILKNKDKILDGKSYGIKKRKKNPEFLELDKCVLKWFEQCRVNKISVSGPILQEKALTFAKSLGKPEFHLKRDIKSYFEKFPERVPVSRRRFAMNG